MREQDGVEAETELHAGEPAERIAGVARERGFELVVMGTQPTGAAAWVALLGSVPTAVGARLACREAVAAGNPAQRDDWYRLPDGTLYDFLAFARSEGRFAPHFDHGGGASEEIKATAAERLANWRTLQELAGMERAGATAERVAK